MRRRGVLALLGAALAGCVGTGTEEPEPDQPIEILNEDDTTHIVSVTVTQGERTVHEDTYEVPGQSSETVFNLRSTTPEGIEQFTVSVTAADQSRSAEIETSTCDNGLRIQITEDSELSLIETVC